MGTALATLRTRLRTRLRDADAAIWSNAELDEAITGALDELSRYKPRERRTTFTDPTPGRELDVSSLTDRIAIVAVETPIDSHPRRFRRFEEWGDTVRIVDNPEPAGADIRVHYAAVHVINGTRSLPAQYDTILLLGASWKACDQKAVELTDAITTGAHSSRNFGSLAMHFRLRFEDRVRRLQGVRLGRMYAPHEPTATKSSDPGP